MPHNINIDKQHIHQCLIALARYNQKQATFGLAERLTALYIAITVRLPGREALLMLGIAITKIIYDEANEAEGLHHLTPPADPIPAHTEILANRIIGLERPGTTGKIAAIALFIGTLTYAGNVEPLLKALFLTGVTKAAIWSGHTPHPLKDVRTIFHNTAVDILAAVTNGNAQPQQHTAN